MYIGEDGGRGSIRVNTEERSGGKTDRERENLSFGLQSGCGFLQRNFDIKNLLSQKNDFKIGSVFLLLPAKKPVFMGFFDKKRFFKKSQKNY